MYARGPEGKDFEFDSKTQLQVEEIKFDWSGQTLKVTINAGLQSPIVAFADFSDSEQRWTSK